MYYDSKFAKRIEKNKLEVIKNIRLRGLDFTIVNDFLETNKSRKKLIKETEERKAKLNKISRKKPDKKTIVEAKKLKDEIKEKEEKIAAKWEIVDKQIRQIPNPDLLIKEKNNQVIDKWPKMEDPQKGGKNYLEIAEKLDIIDVKRAAKVSGTRFGYLKGSAALLEFALIQLAFDVLTKEGFVPIIPPVMIKEQMMEGTGHITEKDKDEKYFIEKDNLYLAGSAEQTLVSMHADEVFNEKDLPKRYVGFSACFRREAGSYGKDTKGIFRVHQFDKIEMVSFCKPEDSIKEHKFLLSMQEKLMKLLKIPYQVVQIGANDLAFPAAAAYDIEAWMPSEGRHRETHTTFNDTDFQTRRLNIKYRSKKGTEFVHALNGTAFAIGRTIIAIIENYQQKDGSVKIPQVLQKYIKIKEIK